MSTYFQFLILGVGAGAVYALLGLGLVLKYRAAGVIDFAHGATSMFAAYVFVELRSAGRIQFPWPVVAHELTIASEGVSTPVAVAITLVYMVILGLIFFFIAYRPLLNAAPLTRVCASVGLMLLLQSIAIVNFGTEARSTAAILPSGFVSLGSVNAPIDRFYFGAVVCLVGVALAVVYRFTSFGLSTRASADNELGASISGISPPLVAAQNWVVATLLAAVAGILITPIATLNPSSYTLFVIPALGAALVARFSSFSVTLVAGLLIGMLQALMTKLVVDFSWLPDRGLPQGLPFLVIIVAVALGSSRTPSRGQLGGWKNPSLGRPTRPAATAAALFVAGGVLLAVLQGSLRAALLASIVTTCLCLSLVVVTGYVGQVSLAQMAFAGVSAFMLSRIGGTLGIPFPFSLILAALCAVPLGILIGLPSLRFRGVTLAVLTLSAAVALDALLFNNESFSGGQVGVPIDDPQLFGLSVSRDGDGRFAGVAFGLVLLGVTCLAGLLVARLRNSAAGRMLIAVRSNERAAPASGIDVTRAKLFAFALSSFLAGIGGGLLAYSQSRVSALPFNVFMSLSLLAICYVGGISRISGAVVAGVLLSNTGLMVTYADKLLHIGRYQAVLAGFALMMTAVANPDGLASTEPGSKGPAMALVKLKSLLLPQPVADKAGSTS